MQERKNKRLAVSMIILVITIVVFWFFAFREAKIEVDETAFVVENMAGIDRVDMISSRDTVVLRYDGTKWMVNDTYLADRRTIQVLFGTIEHVKPRRPVSEKRKAEAIEQLKATGTTVTFFSKDVPLKTYIVGGISQKPEAWFQLPGGEPVIMNIPGYRVYASGVFEQTVNDWRDKRVFPLGYWRNFKSLTTTFTKDRETFIISGKGSLFNVEGMEADTAKVNTYLDDVSLLVGEGFYTAGQRQRIDSLLAGPTSFEVTVTDVGNRSQKLEVFPPLRNEADVYGRVNGEIMIFPRAEMARIAKKKSWFRATPE
ncbi:MAG TPA: DUF4340 domain-containing protein [Cyclobacteriaceae bacterium]|nr:DUF4340 domain-containing protein [Cyclobacteriaceae bacterium]